MSGAVVASTVDPIVLTSYLEGESRFVSSVYETVNIEICDDRSYWAGWSEWWDTDRTIVAVEHDMQVDDALVESIYRCKYRLCAYKYKLHWPSTSKPEPVWAQRKNPPLGPPLSKYLGEAVGDTDLWADYTGVGFVKVSPECRVFPLVESHWSHVDMAVNAAIVGRWHLHGEVFHDHR